MMSHQVVFNECWLLQEFLAGIIAHNVYLHSAAGPWAQFNVHTFVACWILWGVQPMLLLLLLLALTWWVFWVVKDLVPDDCWLLTLLPELLDWPSWLELCLESDIILLKPQVWFTASLNALSEDLFWMKPIMNELCRILCKSHGFNLNISMYLCMLNVDIYYFFHKCLFYWKAKRELRWSAVSVFL